MKELKLDFVMVDRKKEDMLPEKGSKNNKYHLKNVTIFFLGDGLVRIIGSQEIWEFFSYLSSSSASFLYGVRGKANLLKINTPPHPNWPSEMKTVIVPWYDRIFGGPKTISKEIYQEGWFQTGELPFNFVIHSSRLTGWDDRCKLCNRQQYEPCDMRLHEQP